jgi:hypothetical protein
VLGWWLFEGKELWKVGKVVLVHVMKVYGAAEVLVLSFLTLALDGERSATCPGCFTSGKGTPSTYWRRSGPQIWSELFEVINSSLPFGIVPWFLAHTAHSLAIALTALCWLPFLEETSWKCTCSESFDIFTPPGLSLTLLCLTPLTSKCCILYIYSTNTGTEYFKHGIYSPFFSLQNAVCFIILTYLVPVLFTFYIQDVLKLNNSGAKRLKRWDSKFL